MNTIADTEMLMVNNVAIATIKVVILMQAASAMKHATPSMEIVVKIIGSPVMMISNSVSQQQHVSKVTSSLEIK